MLNFSFEDYNLPILVSGCVVAHVNEVLQWHSYKVRFGFLLDIGAMAN